MMTMEELARKIGLSRYTVSKVLQGDSSVREVTRRRVFDACRRYGYSPNSNAVGLAKGYSNLVGVAVPVHAEPFYAEFLRWFDDHTARRGLRMTIRFSRDTPDSENEILRDFMAAKVRAAIIAPTREPDAALHAALAAGAPVVYLEHSVLEHACCVATDYRRGTAELTRHLLCKGRMPAYLGTCRVNSSRVDLIQSEGYADVMREAGLPPRFISTAYTRQTDDNMRAGYDNFGRQLYEGPIPDALIAVNDSVAAGAMRAIFETGLRPGSDILVAGHDNMQFCPVLHPSLTSVTKNKQLSVTCCFEILDALFAGRIPDQSHFVLDPILYRRESTGDADFAQRC